MGPWYSLVGGKVVAVVVVIRVVAVVVVAVDRIECSEKGGEKGCQVDHGPPCGSLQQPLEAPAGLQLWLNQWWINL